MKNVGRAADVGARRTWLWRNRGRFGGQRRAEVPQLLVDVSTIIGHDAGTGIQRVVRGVWSELAKRDGEGFVARPVFATNRHGYCYAPGDFLDVQQKQLKGDPIGLAPGDKFLGLDLSAHLLPKYREQLRAWRKNGGTTHLVVYDLLPLERPEWFTRASSNHFRRWFEILANDVDVAICISDQVARQLASKLRGTTTPRISRLQMGSDMSGSRPSTGLSADAEAALARMRTRPTILMVGTIEPRKGYDAALDAFEHLWRDAAADAHLLIVGRAGWKTAELQKRLLAHPERGNRLEWLDNVSDEALALFYEHSRGVLVTSRGEGFGLPLVEAAVHRRHVLARNLAVFHEQHLPNVIYFGDDSPPSLAGCLVDLLAASLRRPAPVSLPTWSESVDRLLVEMGVRETTPQAHERYLRSA